MKKIFVVIFALLIGIGMAFSEEKAGTLYGDEHVVLVNAKHVYSALLFHFSYDKDSNSDCSYKLQVSFDKNTYNGLKDIKIYIGDENPITIKVNKKALVDVDGEITFITDFNFDTLGAMMGSDSYTIKINFYDKDDNIESYTVDKQKLGSCLDIIMSLYGMLVKG